MMVIKMAPGSSQASKLKKAKRGPPNLKPKAVMVWVVLGPGSMLQNAFKSSSVCLSQWFFSSTIL
jgi:hypothetical protein